MWCCGPPSPPPPTDRRPPGLFRSREESEGPDRVAAAGLGSGAQPVTLPPSSPPTKPLQRLWIQIR